AKTGTTENFRDICVGAVDGKPCPSLAPAGEDCPNPPDTTHNTPFKVTTGLNLIDSTSVPADTTTGSGGAFDMFSDVCGDIRLLRRPELTAEQRDALIDVVVKSNKFHLLNVQQEAAQIGFEARYGSYVAVSIGGEDRYATGSSWAGPFAGTWPCAAAVD